jgi:plasmid stabilization system protein ParE
VDYRLLFTQIALDDLAEIIGHIAKEDDDVASRFGNALLDHVDVLTRFPRMGSTVRKRSRVRRVEGERTTRVGNLRK